MSSNPFSNHIIGMGTMSLCITTDRPTKAESIQMIEELVDQDGLTFIDTANAYCLNDEEFGYGEEILATVVGRPGIVVGTKGGFIRPDGAWKRRGDPTYLRSACEASLAWLGAESIDLYQYHTPDPDVPYEDSIGELVKLRNDGKIQHIGVSNVTLEQLTIAKEMADVRSVQNPLSILFHEAEKHDPILRYCEANDIVFLAYAPLGGHRNPYILPTVSQKFNQLAESLSMTTYQLALLTLRSLSPSIIPIPGSKSRKHVQENLAIKKMSLTEENLRDVNAILDAPPEG